ncbi:unnamed protein product [Aspergillus oryzae]|nr:unnamed protein product [Aspergillus oryzae]GMF83924.1 unnamed protein product [Aspergillus oryzae]
MTIQSLHLKLFRWYGQTKPPLLQHSSDHLALIPVAECQDEIVWGEQSLNCIHYQSEWRVKLNNRVVVKDTEQDLTSPPSDHWTRILLAWTHLYRLRKKLRLQISLNYIEDTWSLPTSTDKRGKSSVTKRMLAEQTSGQHSVWRDVYRVTRCPGPPCRHEGQNCWQDPDGSWCHRLKTHHPKALVKYVDQSGLLESHNVVPDSLREQLYAKEKNSELKRRKFQRLLPSVLSILQSTSTIISQVDKWSWKV